MFGAQTFVKTVNYQHIMPTRYTLDVDLKAAVPTDATETSEKRKVARQVRSTPATRRFALCMCRCVLNHDVDAKHTQNEHKVLSASRCTLWAWRTPQHVRSWRTLL